MKKILLALATLSLSFLVGCGGADENAINATEIYGSDTLRLYNWGEYIGDDIIKNFQKEFNVKVLTEFYDSNEMMYTKLKTGESYDVIIPSDYMIDRLIKEGYLQELDHDLIPNLSNLVDGVKNLPYDPDQSYSIPYFWGNVGILYNHNNVDPKDVEEEGFNVLRNTDYKGQVYLYDSERDAFMVAFKALGYSMNTSDENEINEAYEWLLELSNTMAPSYVKDEVIDSMMNGNKDMAVLYSGDAAMIIDENEDMSFYMPENGTNWWVDGMVIPANSENPLLAHEFINYILSYDASYNNSETVGYASTHKDVLKEMSETYYDGNEAYLPRTNNAGDEIFKDNQTLKEKLSNLWIRVKASN